MSETFADLLALCIPAGESEERWAYAQGIQPRTLRRYKESPVKIREASLAQLAKAMRALGGTDAERIERIRTATGERPAAKRRRPRRARRVRVPSRGR